MFQVGSLESSLGPSGVWLRHHSFVALPKARIGSRLVYVAHSVLVVPPAALFGFDAASFVLAV